MTIKPDKVRISAAKARRNLPFLEAQALGKTVQILTGKGWVDCNKQVLLFNSDMYRIKPEPTVLYVNKYPNGTAYVHFSRTEAVSSVSADAVWIAKPFKSFEDNGCAGKCVCGHNCIDTHA